MIHLNNARKELLTVFREYWDQGAWNDPNPIYSWQKFANLQGYATLAVDRYGNGASTRGDPLQDVQLPLEAELLYQVIQKIKAGEISGQKSRVVFVGHSLGSQSGQFLLKSHPDAVDAAILTGLATSSNPEAFNLTLELRNKPARDFVPRFAHLPQGYLVNTVAQVRETLFYSNAYDHSIPAKDFKTRGTLAVGEILDFPSFAVPEYIAPLFVLTGNNDKLFCSPDPKDDCRAGLQGVRPTYFPNSSNFDYFSVPLTGHDLDFHFSAPVAFLKAHEWLKKVLHP